MNSTIIQESTTPFLDIHVLNYSGVTKVELKTCLASLIDSDVTVRVIENDTGSIAEGRRFGYETASLQAKYVSYVDADDYLKRPLDRVLAKLKEQSPKALFTNSVILEEGKAARTWNTPGTHYIREKEFMGGPTPHQLVVFDRQYLKSIISKVDARPELIGRLSQALDLAVVREVSQDRGWYYLPDLVYVWAAKTNSGRTLEADDNRFINELYERVRYENAAPISVSETNTQPK